MADPQIFASWEQTKTKPKPRSRPISGYLDLHQTKTRAMAIGQYQEPENFGDKCQDQDKDKDHHKLNDIKIYLSRS